MVLLGKEIKKSQTSTNTHSTHTHTAHTHTHNKEHNTTKWMIDEYDFQPFEVAQQENVLVRGHQTFQLPGISLCFVHQLSLVQHESSYDTA